MDVMPAPFHRAPELSEFRDSVRKFVERELIPLETEMHDSEKLSSAQKAQLRERARQAGFWMMDIPEELGGQGLPLEAMSVFWEEVGRTAALSSRDHDVFGPIVGTTLCSLTGALRERYLDPVLAGVKKTCFAQTEPDAGSDPASLRTRAVRDGDFYILSGNKRFIGKATQADFAQVFVRTDSDGTSKKNISCLLVDLDTPGVTVRSTDKMIMGDRLDEIHFDEVRVPVSQRVGDEGQGFAFAQESINHGRIRHAAAACGAMERCLALTAEYTRQRRTFGEAIADRQGVQWMLAEGYQTLHAARLLTMDAAAKVDAGIPVQFETFMAKLFAVEQGFTVVDRCLQLHGATGLSKESVLHRFWLEMRSFRITEGATEVLKTTLARRLLASFA